MLLHHSKIVLGESILVNTNFLIVALLIPDSVVVCLIKKLYAACLVEPSCKVLIHLIVAKPHPGNFQSLLNTQIELCHYTRDHN